MTVVMCNNSHIPMARFFRPKRLTHRLKTPWDSSSSLVSEEAPTTAKQGTHFWTSSYGELFLFTSLFSLRASFIFIWTFTACSTLAQGTPPSPTLSNQTVIRRTVHGQIQGYIGEVLPGEYVEYYLSVPYAAPPIGDLRFENPQEPKPWKEVLVTDKYPPACMQKFKIYIWQHRANFDHFDEDCLYLNVYVPRTTNKELLPVFAFVHGGSNIAGMASMHHGDVFASHTKVIVVMMNYRLAAFGFLTLAHPDLPGNYGLMDQLLALKWIQKNIEFFGGDKNKVTLSGHSAGAGDVGLHTLSSMAKGLFRYSICQSGSGTAHWAALRPNQASLEKIKDYMKRLDCLKKDPLQTKICLKKKSAKLITTTWITPPPEGYSFYAVESPYLPGKPEDLFARVPLNSETMMLGVTINEGTIAGMQMAASFDAKSLIRLIHKRKIAFPQVPHIDDLIIHEYMQWENLYPETNTTARISISKLFGDHSLTYPIVQCIELLAKRKFPVYFYVFYHRSTEDKRPDWIGVPHGEDMFYLFGSPLVGHELKNYTELDKEVSKTLMTVFGNFIKTGKAFIGEKNFSHYTTEEKLFIKFYSENNTARVDQGSNYLPRRMAFWNKLVSSLRNKSVSEERERIDKDEEMALKTLIFQRLTWIFVSVSIFLFILSAILLFLLYKKKQISSS